VYRVGLAAAVVCAAAVAAAAVGLGAGGSRPGSANASRAIAAGAGAPPKRVTAAHLVGQTLMGAMDGTTPSPALLDRIRRGELGGVILFGGNITTTARLSALIAELQAAAKAGGNPPLLIATDQEGGDVKRLPDGPPDDSAEVMGEKDTAPVVSKEGAATGSYLRKLGINVDLAPVLDVGNASTSFLGSRIFSSSPATTATLGTAFVHGLQSARVGATAKHFPGLGTAPANTDLEIVTVPSTKAELTRRLASFEAAIKGKVKLVMVSNAEYPALDGHGLPASLSPAIVTGLLRQHLGFNGVVITDTMSGPAIVQYKDAPIRALNAGVDVLLYSADESVSALAYTQLLQALRAGAMTRSTLTQAYNRVQELKSWLYPGR
jgi:beta-N-acetylhexosaminidase